MLYVVGDSNAVYTSEFLLASRIDARTLCRVGWTTEDVLSALRNATFSDATGFFVFVGLNDRVIARDLTMNVLQIVAALRAARTSTHVPIFVAPPFCVAKATPTATCTHRRTAARDIARELDADGMGSVLITPHLTRDMYVPKVLQAFKANTRTLDPLHLNVTGYKHVANAVNKEWTMHADGPKRGRRPKKIYEAEPAPAPKVAWARVRAAARASERKRRREAPPTRRSPRIRRK